MSGYCEDCGNTICICDEIQSAKPVAWMDKKKFVIETVQVIKRKYYVSVEDPTWAHDGITCNELDHFSDMFLSEDIISTTEVEEFPMAGPDESVNAATMKFDEDNREWLTVTRWDLGE